MTTTESASNSSTGAHPGRRATWALWGVVAGLLGYVTNTWLGQSVGDDLRSDGDPSEIVAALSRGKYHASAVTGFLAVAALLFFAAGLSRWARQQASDVLALRVAPIAIVASAGALIAAYGVKGMLSAYLSGGFNESSYNDDARYTFFLLDDLAGYFGWWGVTISAACLSYLAFRERLIARWIGTVGALAAVIPVAFLVVFGFTGASGLVCPIFLVVAGIGMSRQPT